MDWHLWPRLEVSGHEFQRKSFPLFGTQLGRKLPIFKEKQEIVALGDFGQKVN